MNKNYQEKFLNLAINLSKKNQGLTADNPSVGCVIVKNNQIISTGVTEICGRPHAEIVAIEKVKNKKLLKDSELYVSLEPCNHFAKSPPCVTEIINNNFKKVIIGSIDPDHRVSGKGIKALIDAGIEVVIADKSHEVRKINCGFFNRIERKRPFITAKIATTLDGKIADIAFNSKWISNDQSLKFSHYLRSINNAVVIGGNSLKFDNPDLGCRLAGFEEHDIIRIVVSNDPNIDLDLKIIKRASIIRSIIVTTKPLKYWENIVNIGVKVIYAPMSNNSTTIDWIRAFDIISSFGINNILVEGGSQILTNLIKNQLIDELYWVRNSKILGNQHLSAIGELPINNLGESLDYFNIKEVIKFDNDIITRFIAKNSIISSPL